MSHRLNRRARDVINGGVRASAPCRPKPIIISSLLKSSFDRPRPDFVPHGTVVCTFVAALIFGSLKGYLIMLAASNLAAIIGFLVARYLARESFESRIRGFESFQKRMNLVEKNQWLAISFVRLMPIFPFALNNYALGLTRVPLWRYLLFSEIIFLPINAVWVFGANSFYSVITSGEVSWVVAGGATAAGLLVLALGYAGKRVFG